MGRPVTERMAETLAGLSRHWKKRSPKAFYLNEADHAEFMATDPPTIESLWGNNPPQRLTEPAFRDVPVRLSRSGASRLYDTNSSGRELVS